MHLGSTFNHPCGLTTPGGHGSLPQGALSEGDVPRQLHMGLRGEEGPPQSERAPASTHTAEHHQWRKHLSSVLSGLKICGQRCLLVDQSRQLLRQCVSWRHLQAITGPGPSPLIPDLCALLSGPLSWTARPERCPWKRRAAMPPCDGCAPHPQVHSPMNSHRKCQISL